MVQMKMVSVYPIRYREGQLEYLMIKRAGLSYNWQCVTGSVGDTMGELDHPPNESPLECAERELFEETGYTSAIIHPFDPPKGFFVDDEDRGKKLSAELVKDVQETEFFIYIALIDQEFDPILNPEEHTHWKWCTFTQAYELILWGIEKKAIRIVNDYLVLNPIRNS